MRKRERERDRERESNLKEKGERYNLKLQKGRWRKIHRERCKE